MFISLFDVSIVTPTDSYIAKIYEPLTKSYTDVGPIVFFGGSTDILLLFIIFY